MKKNTVIIFLTYNSQKIINKSILAAKKISENARKTILDKYALKDVSPKHIAYVKSFSERKN